MDVFFTFTIDLTELKNSLDGLDAGAGDDLLDDLDFGHLIEF